MPCGCGDYDDFMTSRNVRINTQMKADLDRVTQFLCYMCGQNEAKSGMVLPEPIAEWWNKHQKADEKRVLGQMRKKVASFSSETKLGNAFIAKAKEVHPVSDFHAVWFHNLACQVWKEYKSKEQEEKIRKNKKRAALKKLTEDEKKLLGLK
jgi:hypothetical protein